jgi:hypothetical protein
MVLSENRHHAARVKAKRQKHRFNDCVSIRTPAICSCWMCGNPRKWFGERTVQERRAMQSID